jgi:hypothetical protein
MLLRLFIGIGDKKWPSYFELNQQF